MIKMNEHYGGKKAFLRHLYFNTLGFLGAYKKYQRPVLHSDSRVVFVCSGNICRSAMAHHQLVQSSDLEVASIGLDTVDGKPANSRFSENSLTHGVDLSGHKATSATSHKPTTNDVFVCMEIWQCEETKRLFPENDVTLLGLWLPKKRYYIHDPFASSSEYARYCAEVIYKSVSYLKA